MEILVLKITGKAFDEGFQLISRYMDVMLKLLKEKYKLVIVTGGGSIARKYITLARELGINSNYWLDEIGIWVSALNGLLFIAGLQPYTYPHVSRDIVEVVSALRYNDVVVLGGLIPGQSTASVLLEVAEAVGARRVYYFSAVGKVYEKDPEKYPDAKAFDVIKASKLREIIEQKMLPGEYVLIDIHALDLAIRSNIEIQLLHYKEPELIFEALRGRNPGTLILP
ncbi:MAG: UMP kinase [Desulfurococcaceae archaeon]